ncbi:polyketide synthase Pks13 [Corynebacterium freiburgense]|uniref:polyketide synthase Pks13 n=1 Tax=Corynebacterium freiburgense TaxID=556548 RepID=UPI000402095F|nr:polyketide synthase Pks13 [Corynebacterium freiburgense]WJZ03861.1 Phthiocerol/phenolphthiocerol synthesis polyketide synthase type I PpsA [Corynebacterium freiburgense]
MDRRQMTVAELKAWLRAWVVTATGLPEEEITDDKPMESFGLSSRDVVILSGELENLLDVQLDATIAYEYPTIAGLSQRLIEGPSHKPKKAVRRDFTVISDSPGTHDIAIVGMAARYPKALNLNEMWELLISGRDGISELPAGRWSEYAANDVMTAKMSSVSTLGGYLDDIASFDAEFFGLSPVEAANMDPQQRIALVLAWEALEHARIPAHRLRGSNVGVYIGSSNNDYGIMIASDPAEAHPYALTGTASSIIPNRVSYVFDFRGPSVSIDTACSSSLVSVHHAVRALRCGDADIALAGGVNILASPFVTTGFGELGVLSPSGKIHAFSEDADGFVRSDGAGLVVLKRVDDAIADGDNILAVIKGTAVNSDGRSNGLTAPNSDAQIAVLERAYMDAGIDPLSVDYVEAHGTGTILGDPIETTALGQVLGRERELREPLLLGSAKTNFGHTESAAGAAGLIKVVLSMQHQVLPPSINYSGPNPYIDFDTERLEVVQDPREWPKYSGRAIAGISGFGFGGTNAHAVISEFHPDDYTVAALHSPAELDSEQYLLPVSGLLPSRRRQAAADLADYLEGNADLEPVARSLARSNHGRSAAVVTAATKEEAIKRLRIVAEGKKSAGIAVADAPLNLGPVFVYSGFGSQYRKMAKDLLHTSPMFRERLTELDADIIFESGWSLIELIEDDSRTYNTETAQVGITAIQIALTDLLAYFGAKPAAVVGMSMGEIAAAYAAGGLSAKDAMRVACHRSRLMGEGEESLPEDQLGAMAVVEFSAADLDAFIAENPEYQGVEPAVYAGPGMTTIGGPREAVVKLVEKLEAEEKFARLLNVKGAGHTSAVEPLLGELAAETAGIEPRPLEVPLFSSVDKGVVYPVGSIVHESDYWLRCTRGSVWFLEAITAAFAAGHEMLVEICPNPVAIMGMMNTAFSVGKADAQLLFTLKQKLSPSDTLRDLLAKLYVAGAPIQLDRVLGAGDYAEIPGVTWKEQRYWTAARPASQSVALPGHRAYLPDGTVVFSARAEHVPSAEALIDAAAAAAFPESSVVAVEEYIALPPIGEITTLVRKNLGGVAISVYRVTGEVFPLLAEGFASVAGLPQPTPVQQQVSTPSFIELDEEIEAVYWDPESGESVEQRMRSIVSESMGYDIDDLPGELPLIDLGLDSLMGMRIKNRIEHDFQIPPLQVQALRDASVADVVTLVEDLVAGKTTAVSDEIVPVSTAVALKATPESSTRSNIVQVAPRDASERLVFATWASITGAAVPGVTSELPEVTEEHAQAIAERLTERAGIEIKVEDIHEAAALEDLANIVRKGLEVEVEGNIRVLRERPAGSQQPAVFLFHPAGGSSVVYQPLMRRLPEDVPVYGVERLEGTLEERAASYLDEIRTYADGHPVILGGWSFGGALAYEVAHQLVGSDVDIALIVLLDTVQPAEAIPDTMEETRARWERYSAFAKKTYNLDFPVPYELLETQGEDALLTMMAEFLSSTDASAHGLAAGVLEHQRASFVDNRILDRVQLEHWADVRVPVMLFRAERMHDGAIELEPRYANIHADGGWSAIVEQLDIIQLRGDHLAIVDEPEIGTVGAHLTKRLREIEAHLEGN